MAAIGFHYSIDHYTDLSHAGRAGCGRPVSVRLPRSVVVMMIMLVVMIMLVAVMIVSVRLHRGDADLLCSEPCISA